MKTIVISFVMFIHTVQLHNSIQVAESCTDFNWLISKVAACIPHVQISTTLQGRIMRL